MSATEPLHLRFDAFELDEREARLLRGGQPVALAPKTFDVLCALARRSGQLVSKSDLLDAVWGHQFVSDSVLKSTISDLRSALGDDARSPRLIETAARRGYRFIGMAPAAAMASPLPSAPPIGYQAPPIGYQAPPIEHQASLIGRHAALAALSAQWVSAQSGRRQIAWVAGEAGIGKTALIECFVAQAGAARVARGQCVEQHGAGEPYLPVLEALGALCREDGALLPLLRAVAPTWLLQLPWLGSEAEREALRRELAGSGQERMLREWGELVERMTEQRPLLLVTEDLHWSDHATVRLIDHVARRRSPARLMWLASYRLAEVVAGDHPMKSLRHELRLHRLAEETVLDPFTPGEVAEYLARRLPAQPPSEALARDMHGRTDGLPLFLVSVVDELESRGALPQDASGPTLPESLAGVIGHQVDRLSADQRTLLDAASICGVEFQAGVLAAVLQRDAADVCDACDELVRRQQWLRCVSVDRAADGSIEARYAFRHALYRQVFYQRSGVAKRAQLHARTAAALKVRGAAAAELAVHFEAAHDHAAACLQYAEAAQSALQHFAPDEAMVLTSRALALLPRCAASEQLGIEMALLGQRSVASSQVLGITAPETRRAFKRLDELCEQMPERATRALGMGYGWVQFVAGEYAGALDHARRKLAQAEQRGDAVQLVAACNLHGATLGYQGELLAARDWLERGIAAAEGQGLSLASALTVVDLEVSLRSRLSQVMMHLGAIDEGRRQIALAHERVDQLGQPYSRRLVLIFESFFEARQGHPDRVRSLAERLQQIATEHAIAQAEGPARWLRGWALAHLGDPRGGHALIVDGYAMDARLGVMRGRSGVLGFAAEALILARCWPEAAAQLQDARALADRLGERLHLPELHLLAARVALGRGDGAAARAELQAAAQEAGRQHAAWGIQQAEHALAQLDAAA